MITKPERKGRQAEYFRRRRTTPEFKKFAAERRQRDMADPVKAAAAKKASVESRKRYPERVRARNRVYQALKDGKIIRQPCQFCSDPKVQAHHDDYSKPLDVTWVCRACHIREFHLKRVPSKEWSESYEPIIGLGRGPRKTTAEQVIEMRNLYAAGGITLSEIARRYGLGHSTVASIIHRRTWRDI